MIVIYLMFLNQKIKNENSNEEFSNFFKERTEEEQLTNDLPTKKYVIFDTEISGCSLPIDLKL